MSDDLEWMWKEAIVVLFEKVSQHLADADEENEEKPLKVARP
jgi:hypothetical protein